ncbi:MAG: hypothetical protein HFG51_09395 [Lachnospiraceae bacterium]|nr:hypothetical protein [Lachnospiraceae bacterium]
MLWYNNLYAGKKAEKQRFSLIQKLRERRAGASVYVIVPATNPQNLLDIYSAPELFAREERMDSEDKDSPMILGIALGYHEALVLAGVMVNEVYQETGGFALREYLGISSKQCGVGGIDGTDIDIHS